uniref:Uncharacterized protein n=1 Tax=Picea sitchensis TaxID=3332 RepID=A9NST5_PICSI|nr:unknown [Picea sitchensis]
MTMPLEGRVAIVTGASRGIGREIALHLAEKGAKVVVNYSSNQGTAEKVASTINNLASSGDGVRAIVCKADVAEPSQVAQLFDMAEHTFGRLHIVVNNAGILDSKNPTIAQTSDEDWDRIFQVNCKGAFLCSREAVAKSNPFERLGKVEDVAPVVAFLASDQGEWVNGQVIGVNGGRV